MLLLYRFAAQVHNSQNRKQRCSSDSEGTKVQKKSIEALKAEGPKYQCELQCLMQKTELSGDSREILETDLKIVFCCTGWGATSLRAR